MVKQLVEAVRANPKAFDWIAKFGAAVVIGLYLVWFLCGQFGKLVDWQLESGRDNSSAMKTMAASSQRVADGVEIIKQNGAEQAGVHKQQFDFMALMQKRVDVQDQKLDKIDQQSAKNGDYLKQNGEMQSAMLEELKQIRKQGILQHSIPVSAK